MPEPACSRLRPITMMRTLAVVALLVLAGCGSAESTTSSGKDAGKTETTNAKVGSCAADASDVVNARTLTAVDLDGDGKGDVVKLTAASSACPNLVFAKLGERYVSAQLTQGEPPMVKAFGVAVPGHEGALLAVRGDHPRGGFQLRLYAPGGDNELVELKVNGHSVVPFIALDVQEHPLSIDCEDGGVVVTEAVAHEPRGVAFAWDIKRTSYAVDATRVTAGRTDEVADNVLPRKLDAKYPDLVKYTLFGSCRTAG